MNKIKIFTIAFIYLFVLSLVFFTTISFAETPSLAGKKEFIVKRAMTDEAKNCIECHAKKTPGIIESWKLGKMGHSGISCIDCHKVEKSSLMAQVNVKE